MTAAVAVDVGERTNFGWLKETSFSFTPQNKQTRSAHHAAHCAPELYGQRRVGNRAAAAAAHLPFGSVDFPRPMAALAVMLSTPLRRYSCWW
ncbi:hypothetical protein ACQY0O_000880 [Thecaphora frezii]